MAGPPTADAPRGVALQADLPAGHLLDQFRVLAPLGRGGMGVVYEAEDTLLHRRVAVKTLFATPGDPTAAALLREARAAANLDHPNVVRVLHVGTWAGGYYLVLELVRGGSLQARITARRRLRWDTATRAVAQACRGLAAAHAAGFVHRDIKPGNLLLDPAGRVKVADFGLVRGGGLDTSANGTAGTPAYMSPEQCRGEPADARSDVYSLGATYFALLTARLPFPLPTAVQVMFAHCTHPPPDPRELVPGLPAGCAAVVAKAMAKEPSDRYPTADALLAALKALTADAPLEPEPETIPLPPPVDPHTETVAGWGAVVETAKSVRPVRRKKRARNRPRWVLFAGVGVGVALLAVAAAVAWPLFGGTPTAKESAKATASTVGPSVVPSGERPVAGGVRAVAFSPDGKWLAAGGPDGATVWSTADDTKYPLPWRDVSGMAWMTLVKADYGGPDTVMLVAATPNGPPSWLASTRTTGEYIPGWGVNAVGAVVVKAGTERRSAVWCSTCSPGGEIRTYHHGNTGMTHKMPDRVGVRQLLFAPGNDNTLAAVGTDGKVLFFDGVNENPLPDRGGEKSPLNGTANKPPVIAFLPTGVLALGWGDRVRFWNRAKWEDERGGLTLDRNTVVTAMACSADGKRLATGQEDGTVTLWDIDGGKSERRAAAGHKGRVNAVAFSADGKSLASGGADGVVRVSAVNQP